MIADTLNKIEAWVEHDSRCVPIAIKDPEGPDFGCQWIATSGNPHVIDEYGIEEVRSSEIAGHWITIVDGNDGSTAWWNENEEEWIPGEPE
jgi:hypothetical protein